jgi:PKD repeat protein
MKPVCLLLLVLLCAVPAAAMDPVHASFTMNQTEGPAPLTVAFLDTSTGGPTSWMWDFGNGSTSTERNPTYTFVSEGVYRVTLFVERVEPHSADSETLNIYVRIGPEVITDFTATPLLGAAPLAVQFTDLSTNTTSWAWSFGDGGTSTERNPVHTYAAPGNYTVELTADNVFRMDTEMKVGYVSVTGPVTASFTGTPRAVPAGGPVRFTDTSTGNPFTRAWDFGDGTSSSEQNAAHIYDRAGIYNVSLTAANPFDTDTRTETGYITVYDLVDASFSANPTFGQAPLAVQFNDTSTGGPKGWNWTFGDGGTSDEQNPVHTYQNPGDYDVTLTASNGYSMETSTRLRFIATLDDQPPVGGDRGYFLVSTDPPGVDVYLEDISSTRYLKGNTTDGPLNVPVMLTATPMRRIVANLSGDRDAVFTITEYPPKDGTVPVNLTLEPIGTPGAVVAVPPSTAPPTDPDGNGLYKDVNGNGHADFADIVLYFNQMTWIAANEPVSAFDHNGNGRIDFADVVWLFNHL